MHFENRLLLLISACAFLSAAPLLCAQELTAQTRLSNDRVAVGEAIQLQVQIAGLRGKADPPPIEVDGLDVQYLGPSHSSQLRIENGRMSSFATLTHLYTVIPQRAGTFTIPALNLAVDGRTVRTQPVALRVENSASGASRSGGAPERLGFAEFVIARKSLFLGETVPVELRLYVDARATPRLETMPLIGGEGFTKTKLTEPRQELARKDGREYYVFVFRTAVTPSRTGVVTLGPSELVFNAQIREARRGRARSLLEQMLGDDPFNDPFFSPSQIQRVVTKAEAVDLEVKPLPGEGRPKSFSGAVGKFRVTAEGSPRQVKVGDVVTMRLAISGQGNFDRINAPEIVDRNGWQVYPPKSEFKRDDEIGLSGTKTFEMAVIPEARKTEMPTYEFAYFDPDTGRYATVSTGGAPLEVTGAPVAAATPAPARTERPIATKPAVTATPAVTDILGVRYDFGDARDGFVALHENRAFWVAQAAPLAILLGMIAWRTRRTDESTRQTARLRRQKQELWRQLRSSTSTEQFLESATRWVQIETALATGRPDAGVDAAAALASRSIDPETAAAIEELFSARAELLYAGATRGTDGGSPREDRARWMTALERFEKAHAKR